MYKTPHVRTTFGSCHVKIVHTAVARTTFPSQKGKKNDGFGMSRTTFGSCDVEKRTPLWHEAHFEVKMLKAPHVRTTFGSSDVEKVHVVVARSTFPSQNVQSTP